MRKNINNKEISYSGLVSLVGAPNAGKSTLINTIIGEKIAIVSHKSQTTRTSIKGIFLKQNTQIVFIDTPGIFKSKRFLDELMVNNAWKSLNDSDLVCLLYDVGIKKINSNTLEIIKNLKNINRPIVLILNKIDLINKKDLLPLISEFQSLFKFEKIFMLSALKSKGIKDFLDWITKQMPVGPFLYPIEDITDTNLRYLASEILREKLLLNMHQEIPYNLIVSTETWKEKKDNNLEIHQNIFVSKTSHKAMILGKSGQNIKRIGILARKEMEKVFNKRIHLYTRVKIQENCLTNINLLKSSGLNIDA